jgi:hypothetical protein
VNANGVNTLDLESSALKLIYDETDGGGSIGTREDILVHEQTPDQILKLPITPDPGHLQDEHAVIVHEGVDLAEELLVAAETDVLGHFERDDLGVGAGGLGEGGLGGGEEVAEVGAEDSGLVVWGVG